MPDFFEAPAFMPAPSIEADEQHRRRQRRRAALYVCSMAGGTPQIGPYEPGVSEDAADLLAALGIDPVDVRRRP